MAHKFAFIWRVYTFDETTTPPSLTDRGTLDLTTMDENGILANGMYHERPTKANHPISGRVNEFGNETFLVLNHINAGSPSRYRGLLTHERQANLKILGTRFIPRTAVRQEGEGMLVQDEEPWIIFKP